MIFEHNYEVEVRDLGRDNRMTNKAFLAFMEEIAGLHSSTVGDGIEDMPKNKFAWVLMDWQLKVIDRPRYKEILNIKTWARDTTKLYSYRDFEVYDSNGKLVAIASSKWVLIDVEKRRITKIEDEAIEKYNPEPGKQVFNELDIEKIKEPDNYDLNNEYTVKRADIDVNKHMHNLNYLELAYEVLPFDVYENTNKLNSVRITYKKEITLGDTVKCYYTKNDNKHIVTIKDQNDKVVHSVIELE